MAIKGKRKPKSRSGAARKRPAGAPRVSATPVHSVRWYRTMGGQLTIILGVLALIGFAMWRISVNSSEDSARKARQAELAAYTAEVDGYVTAIQQPVREMLGAPFNTGNPEGIVSLEESTKTWIETLEENGALIQALVPPEDLVSTNLVLQQAVLLYGSTAKTYALVPGESGKKRQQELLTRASELREQAGRVLAGAVGILDQARADAGLRPSGIQLPTQMSPIVPTPAPEPSKEPKDSSKNNNNKDKNKKKRNNG